MLKEQFTHWMNTTYADQHNIKNPRVIGNYVSRIGRIEREYKKQESSFTLEKEFQRDGLAAMRKDFSKYGRALIAKGIDLPANTAAIQPYSASLKLYQAFLNEYYAGRENEQ